MKTNHLVLAMLTIFLSGSWLLSAEEFDIFNPMCPVYTDEPSDREIMLVHEGKPLYFCCKKCVRKFKEDPSKFVNNIVYEGGKEGDGDEEKSDQHDHEHDHAHDHGKGSLSLLGKFHPAIIHFPIAGIYFAFFLQMLAHFRKETQFQESIKLFLILTTVFAFLAGLSGWINASGQSVNGKDLEAIDLHRWFGMATGVSILFCTILQGKDSPKNSRHYGFYMVFLILSLILTSITGHLGGLLVFGEQYFQR